MCFGELREVNQFQIFFPQSFSSQRQLNYNFIDFFRRDLLLPQSYFVLFLLCLQRPAQPKYKNDPKLR